MRYLRMGSFFAGLVLFSWIWGVKPTLLWGGSVTSPILLADFDVLKKAEKDLQQDLGLPDRSDSGLIDNPTHQNPNTQGLDDHPVLISFLLFSLGLGIVLLGWVIRNEHKKENSAPQEGSLAIKKKEEEDFEEQNDLPKVPPSRNRLKKKIKRMPLSPEGSHSPGTFLSYIENLDLFLQTLRESSESPEFSCVALYHVRNNYAFHTLLSRSAGSHFPRFFRPALLNESSQEMIAKIRGGEGDAFGMTTVLDGNVDSLCVLFFDQRGVSYLIHFSEMHRECHGKWFRSVSTNHLEWLLILESYLKGYSRFHYQIPEDTFDGYGVLDGRGFENRLFQELERAERLKTETLLFVLSVKCPKTHEEQIDNEEEFMNRFQRMVSIEIRNGDSLSRSGDGNLFLLLPETLEADASIISKRLQKIFEATKEGMHQKDLTLNFRELSMHGTEKEKLFQFLSTI